MNKKENNIQNISVVIPVYNEEVGIAGVLSVLIGCKFIGEIICVNDGSTDNTLSELKKFKKTIKIVNYKTNKGKGHALAKGIRMAQNDVLIFLDGDLRNLNESHIISLLEPLKNKKIRAVLGYIKIKLVPSIFAKITGLRSYYKQDLLPQLEEMSKTRFGVEIFLNNLFTEEETAMIPLSNLRDFSKYEKHKSANPTREYYDEVMEMAWEIGKREKLAIKDWEIISQITKITEFKDLKTRVSKIRNTKVRVFLEDYALRYIKAAKDFWKN